MSGFFEMQPPYSIFQGRACVCKNMLSFATFQIWKARRSVKDKMQICTKISWPGTIIDSLRSRSYSRASDFSFLFTSLIFALAFIKDRFGNHNQEEKQPLNCRKYSVVFFLLVGWVGCASPEADISFCHLCPDPLVEILTGQPPSQTGARMPYSSLWAHGFLPGNSAPSCPSQSPRVPLLSLPRDPGNRPYNSTQPGPSRSHTNLQAEQNPTAERL